MQGPLPRAMHKPPLWLFRPVQAPLALAATSLTESVVNDLVLNSKEPLDSVEHQSGLTLFREVVSPQSMVLSSNLLTLASSCLSGRCTDNA